MLKQYGCSPVSKSEVNTDLKKIEELIKPMKLVGSMSKDKMVKVTIEMVDMFVKNLENLLAIFDHSY